MQNFTLGKKGFSMLLFTLILLTGSLPSFAQDCPTAPSQQIFCDSQEPTIDDLQASQSDIEWYASQDSDTPLLSTQVLLNGATYYAGTSQENCARVPVTVVVYSQPEVTGINATTPITRQSLAVIGICVADVNDSGVTVGDLRTNYQDVDGVQVNWYLSRTSDTPLSDDTVLLNNTDYFAGLTILDQDDSTVICETNRRRTTVRLYTEDAPTGDDEQEFCAANNPTLADIVASGTNRYFVSAESETELSADTPLVDGTTYFLSSLGEFCESVERLAVTVSVIAPNAGDDNLDNQECRTDTDLFSETVTVGELETYFTSLLQNADSDGTFSDLATIADALNVANYQTQTFTVTYTVDGDSDCPDTAELSVEVVAAETANAGSYDDVTYCSTEGVIDLTTLTNLDDTATTGGTFTGDGVVDNQFDPSVAGVGTHTINYTVDENAGCVEGVSTTDFTITVEQAPVSGEISESYCITEASDILIDPIQVIPYFVGLLENLGAPINQTYFRAGTVAEATRLYNFIQTPTSETEDFVVFYDIPSQTDACVDGEIVITITINNTQPADAGEINNQTVCAADGLIDLNTFLEGSGAMTNGNFTSDDVIITNNTFDTSVGAGTYTITYTVDESAGCVEGVSTSDFTITVIEAPISEQISRVFCYTDAQDFIGSSTEAFDYFVSLVEGSGITTVDDAQFEEGTMDEATRLFNFIQNPDADTETFTTTYTVPTDNEICENGLIEIAITINSIQEAEAGEIPNQTVCATDGLVDLTTFLPGTGALTGGTFEGEGVDDDGMFDPSIGVDEDGYEITYTVSSTSPCVAEGTSDSTTFTIFVTPAPISDEITETFCVTEAAEFVASEEDAMDYFTSLVEGLGLTVDETQFGEGTSAEAARMFSYIQNPDADSATFNVSYTVIAENDACENGVVTIAITLNDTQEADAGDIADQTVCSTEGLVDLTAYLAGSGAMSGGTFTGPNVENGMFNATVAGANEDGYEITYTVDDTSYCVTEGTVDSDTFTITVIEPEAAEAGEPVLESYCVENTTDINLISLLDAGANTRGSFSAPYENGIFNPSVAGAGEYVITYTVDEDDCAIGSDSTTITITVDPVSVAPTADAEQTFCFGDNPTVASLQATGDNVVWYTDAALTTEAATTTTLEDGDVYYAAEAGDNECGRNATMVTVNLIDSLAPTLPALGNEFCRQDSPTVQELIDNLSGSNIQVYSSATGGAPLAASTALQNNMTYYATATDQSACESSERLPITVSVGFCGIPEGFSPNGDNVNDTFEIPNIRRDYPNYNIEIYNRWGNLVYRGNEDWDGVSNQSTTLGDKVLPAGVYFYILNYNDGQTTPVQGKVYLSR